MNGNMTINQLLAEQEENYQKSRKELDELAMIPEGRYSIEINEVKFIVTKATAYSDQKQRLQWKIKIIDGNHKGRIVTRLTDITGDSIKWTTLNLRMCGQEPESLSELPNIIKSGKLIGIKLDADINVYEGKDGKQRNSFWLRTPAKEIEIVDIEENGKTKFENAISDLKENKEETKEDIPF